MKLNTYGIQFYLADGHDSIHQHHGNDGVVLAAAVILHTMVFLDPKSNDLISYYGLYIDTYCIFVLYTHDLMFISFRGGPVTRHVQCIFLILHIPQLVNGPHYTSVYVGQIWIID